MEEEYYHPLYHPEKVWRNKTGVIVAIVALVLVVFICLFVLAWSLILTFAAPSTIQQNPEVGTGLQLTDSSSQDVANPNSDDAPSHILQTTTASLPVSDFIDSFTTDKISSITVRLKKPLKRYPHVK